MKKRNDLTKKIIYKLYWIDNYSAPKTAIRLNCSTGLIYNKMNEFGILRRTQVEASKFINRNGKKNYNYNPERHQKYYCVEPNCNNEISYLTWKFGTKKCQSCIFKTYKETRRGKGNPMYGRRGKDAPGYIDGRSFEEYPDEFFRIRNKIRKRDNHICQIHSCGKTEIENGRKLDVHHIDYNKENCDENNLITLCKNCNSRVNSNRDYWRKYFEKLTIQGGVENGFKVQCGTH